MPRRIAHAALWIATGAVLATASVVAGWMIYNRKVSGEWRMPTTGDFIRVKQRLLPRTYQAPKTVYLHRGPIELVGGAHDDAARNISSIIGRTGEKHARLPGFRGSSRQWRSIVKCVRATFKPFDIEFVESRPQSGDYFMVVVGGHPRDIQYKGHHVGGLAPFNGEVIPGAIVFVFAKALGNRKRAVCNTLAMEVAHAYGLDHAYDCSDVMTYLPDCGPKFFRDRDVPCGEHKPRACPGGHATQNSYRKLAEAVGIVTPPR